ncbi:hypothetical protein SAMN02745227_01844 [Anaerobranca californiensis DSM 14826]|jgi:hypothetical protein|uniref:Uncharacterized protein n=1 Tax=Anaerobranca californiensis DSM 14826 TaxID=1120989 RepID=A0A1M6QS79_9FIRM|nr:hypothetical protein [Anaerobranca californiensis]SHK22960.1 hypothetical protein SAMN02745227_01844 [Anaerobranca californiensis DSM 14826]
MKWLEKLQRIDRKIIYAVLLAAIIIPLLFPLGIEVKVSQATQDFYNIIENLPKGSVILISYDFDAASAPELYPQAQAITRHALNKGHKIIAVATWYAGPTFADRTFNAVAGDKEYGKDYVNLGFKPGGGVMLNALARDIHQTFPEDVTRTKIGSIPIMQNVKNINDIDLIISLSAGDPGTRTYVEQIGSQYDVPILTGVTAVSAPGMTPYLQSGDLKSMISGLAGAAQYETLINRPGLGLGGMDAQSVAHFTIIAFILVGNIAYVVTKKKKK